MRQTEEERMVRADRARYIAIYRRWTNNSRKGIISTIAGSNFCCVGGDRKHCSIITPEMFDALVKHGILAKVAGGYRFVTENA